MTSISSCGSCIVDIKYQLYIYPNYIFYKLSQIPHHFGPRYKLKIYFLVFYFLYILIKDDIIKINHLHLSIDVYIIYAS